MLSPAEFSALAAQGYTRIPLMLETAADLETPAHRRAHAFTKTEFWSMKEQAIRWM